MIKFIIYDLRILDFVRFFKYQMIIVYNTTVIRIFTVLYRKIIDSHLIVISISNSKGYKHKNKK